MHLVSVIFFALAVGLAACYTRVIIVEEAKACFRRVLAGKRVSRSYVKRTLYCERIEECQQECARERKFVCEGFNYRVDPSGRPRGECELVDLPLARMDFSLDLFRDPDYDYYERDRDSTPECVPRVYYPLPPPRKDVIHLDIRPSSGEEDRGSSRRGTSYDESYHASRRNFETHRRYRPTGYHYPTEYFPRAPPRPYLPTNGDSNKLPSRVPSDRRYEQEWGLRRREYAQYGGVYGTFGRDDAPYYNNVPSQYHDSRYNSRKYSYSENYYIPQKPEYKYYDNNYLPQKPTHGSTDRTFYTTRDPYPSSTSLSSSSSSIDDIVRPCGRICYEYSSFGGTKDWGRYGGSYGNAGKFVYLGYKDSYDYWGFNRGLGGRGDSYEGPTPFRGRPQHTTSYQPVIGDGSRHTGEGFGQMHASSSLDSYGNRLGGPGGSSKRVGGAYNFLKDECSLRTATGFRLSKNTVQKFLSVHSIYECELQCVKEKEFVCNSYAYRYTITLSKPTDNCYLSDRNYKSLDFYTDLEPDRDFDIYTMNNPFRCEVPVIRGVDHSDCFWRVRSGQRLDSHIVKDTMNVKNIVECQIECLRAIRFTCRAFSYRYGPPNIGGVVDNCQLTDWPFLEMDPRVHMRPEPGFEIYDRGSFGHGCEPDHFAIRGKRPVETGAKTDQLCYVGYGTPARLLPSAIRKAIYVDSEFDCKQECSKSRSTTLLQCMSFSYRLNSPKGVPNCELSDILQRDLLLDLDYVSDTNSWLFAWDNYNPQCVSLAFGGSTANDDTAKDSGTTATVTITQEGRIEYESLYPLDIWRVYSVSGWPCKRGSLCRENKEAGFWFCELEGGSSGAWDYCCRPTHQCGYSSGYGYQWCYVGPLRTQWRKCNDRYYPYLHHFIDRNDNIPPEYQSYLPDNSDRNPWPQNPPVHSTLEPPFRPGYRPDRPPARPTKQPIRPSLDEYENKFDSQFLEPPKPGGFNTPQGFGQPRHWPVNYLHKEIPPNETVAMPPPPPTSTQMPVGFTNDNNNNQKFQAIQNLIDIIKSNDLNNVQYQISNHSNKKDDVLYVKIPLPTTMVPPTSTTTAKTTRNTRFSESTLINLEPIDVFSPINFTNGTAVLNSKKQYQNLRTSREQSSHNFFTNNPSGYADDLIRTSVTSKGASTGSFGTTSTGVGSTTFEKVDLYENPFEIPNKKIFPETRNPFEIASTVGTLGSTHRINVNKAFDTFGVGISTSLSDGFQRRSSTSDVDFGSGTTAFGSSTFERRSFNNKFDNTDSAIVENNSRKQFGIAGTTTTINDSSKHNKHGYGTIPNNPFEKGNPFEPHTDTTAITNDQNPFEHSSGTTFKNTDSNPSTFAGTNTFLTGAPMTPKLYAIPSTTATTLINIKVPDAIKKVEVFEKSNPFIENDKDTPLNSGNPFEKKKNPFEGRTPFLTNNPLNKPNPFLNRKTHEGNDDDGTYKTIRTEPFESTTTNNRKQYENVSVKVTERYSTSIANGNNDIKTTLQPPSNFNANFEGSTQHISKTVDQLSSSSSVVNSTTTSGTNKMMPTYRKGHIMKTNVTNYGRRKDNTDFRFLK